MLSRDFFAPARHPFETRRSIGMMTADRKFRSEDGRDWLVTLEAPGKLLAVPPSLERSGANLPEHQILIVFTSGEESVSEEYTALTPLEDLSESELNEWYQAARRGHGV